MTIAEQIYTLVKDLSQAEASEVLAFAEFIWFKRSTQNLATSTVDDARVWTELVDSLAGSWADDFPSLESIRAGEGQDIRRENL